MKTLLLPLLSLAFFAVQHRDPLEYIEILESADRVQKLQVDRVVAQLGVPEGALVADVGAGSGLFTRPLARQVGSSGTVYAVDVDSELLKHVSKTASRQKLTNIRTVQAGEHDPRIPEPVDLILLVDTLHHISERGDYVKTLRRYLKPDGRVVVIDFSENWPSRHELMRYELSQLESWMTEAGFQKLAQYDFLEGNFFVVYGVAG